ncbi:MAG: hypothetical protein CLLPBCKN_006805 [Chroococcidiopsis cubana SAG 39.79]|nr:hypothetical protein [Chroococcidiopsis cubana SAG 39.79]
MECYAVTCMKAIVFDQVTERYRVSLGLGGSVPLASRRDRAAWVQALTKIALC